MAPKKVRFKGIRDVGYWHFADKPPAPADVRFWTKADNDGFRPTVVCPLMDQSEHFSKLSGDQLSD
jgi:hypothetical protein